MTLDAAEDRIADDLERFVEVAKSLGANDAVAIPSSWIVVDDRVRMKCRIPRCPSYGRAGNCPPHVPRTEEVRAALSNYRFAVLFKLEGRATIRTHDLEEAKQAVRRQHADVTDIAAKLESLAFNRGYYLAMGLGAGSCLHSLCADEPCGLLETGVCRHQDRARPSMEALGIDVFAIARRVGWPLVTVNYSGVDSRDDAGPWAIGIVFVC